MTGDTGCAYARGITVAAEPPTERTVDLSRPVCVNYVLASRFTVADRAFASHRGAAVAGLGAAPVEVARTRAAQLIDLARFEAIRGRDDRCRQHLREALALAGPSSRAGIERLRNSILGLLELGLGNLVAAADHLGRCAQATTAGALDSWLRTYEADHAEALLALGRELEARAAVARQHERARRSPEPRALAAAARARALLADSPAFEYQFEAALALHDLLPGDFERARTQLCYGERLRRARRRIDSREQLETALAMFEALGAVPWAERARRELDASCRSHHAPGDPAARDILTAQEMRVASIVAGGATVREAAAQLFLSAKTIEAHLGRAYRKLDVHNRAQLVTALSHGG
ncbi:MAG TPA: helix-turn-helix transcriptional regulator [Solirubrobacteraceae bacterium]|nr:helix-turn-helix transcriptional regulator [Solirubrobacteraceae bacterium]